MNVQFAGSRCVDDRRRRRLATDQGSQDSKPRSRSRSKKNYINTLEELQKKAKPRPETPIHSLIPSQPGRFLILNAAIVLGWAALFVVCSWRFIWFGSGSDFDRMMSLTQGPLWTLFPGMTFLLTAQASWLVYWYRRDSRRDFHGRYRIWLWTSIDWALMGMCALTGIHLVIADQLLAVLHLPADPYRNLLWITPLAAILVNLSNGLDREMGACPASWRWLCLSLTAALLTGFQLIGWRPFQHVILNSMFLTGMSSFVPLALLLATLNQLHFVLYVTHDAIQREQSFWTKAGKTMSGSTSRFFGSSLLTVGWIGGFIAAGYRYGMKVLFAWLLWKPLSELTETGKKKPKKKAASKAKAETPSKTTRGGRRVKEVEEEVEDQIEEETYDQSEEEVDESYEEELSEEETGEDTEEELTEEAQEKDEAASTSEEWDQSAWEEEMRAYQQPASPVSSASQRVDQSSKNAKPHFKLSSSTAAPRPAEPILVQAAKPAAVDNRYEAVSQQGQSIESSTDEEGWNEYDDANENDGLDPSQLRGLSKKERRKLRKQVRDQERGGR